MLEFVGKSDREQTQQETCDRMNTMSLQRRRENPLIFCCLLALTLLLCVCGRPKWLTTASASADETSKGKNKRGFQISDFFPNLIGDKGKNAGASASGDGSARTQFGQSQNQGSQQRDQTDDDDKKKDRRGRGKPNKRKVLYDLSVRAHYERLLHEQQEIRNVSSTLDDLISFDDSTTSSCEYYNDGMHESFDIRDMAKTEESIFSRCSHWTFKLCSKRSISQIHLEPSAIPDGGNTAEDDDSQTLKLPPDSILSNSIQFHIQTVHHLGVYLPPWTPDYEKHISDAWGSDETKFPIPHGLVEYYVGGDVCRGSRRRQSKVIYDPACCKRRNSMMEEFFQNDGHLMIRSVAEPEPCRYVLKACKICPVDEAGGKETPEAAAKPEVDPSDFNHLLQTFLQYPPFGTEAGSSAGGALPPMPPSQIEANKQLLQSMFSHAYDSYFHNAFPASELKPLTCQPGVFNLVKIPALTLIDTLDTFIIMGNYTEFARSVERLRYLDERMKREFQSVQGLLKEPKDSREGEEGGLFSVNKDVSLFETTIRVLGGLLSAHQMAVAFMTNLVSKTEVWDSDGDVLNSTGISDIEIERTHGRTGDSQSCLWESSPCSNAESGGADDVEEGHDCRSDINKASKKGISVSRRSSSPWEYDGFLLELAHDIGKRLVYAFDTRTGIPYGTVNLLHGIPPGETPVASLAGAGTLSLEFELLSRLTGDQSFGKAAKLATRALWIRQSADLHLFGKHIDAQSGKWKEYLSGVGSNSDSFYEYLLKHYLLFPDDSDFWTMFLNAYSGVLDNSRLGEWYVDVDMTHGLNGHVRQVFESLMAFWPGLQVHLGELVPAAKTLNSFFLVREFLGLLPERFNFAHWRTEGAGDVHPLRPELLESCFFLHLASIGLHGSKRGPCSNASSSQHTSSWLWAADFALHAVHQLSWTPCGFATVTKVGQTTTGGLSMLDFVGVNGDPLSQQKRLGIQHHDEMPSYFLTETIKYLYLTFDDENVLHTDNEREWIFTTEAHPIHYVPVSNSTMQGDDHINAQADQVRSLLKEIMSDSPPSIDEGFGTNASSTQNLEHEQWTDTTPEPIFVASIRNAELEITASKRENYGIGDFESGPPFEWESFTPAEVESYGIYLSEIVGVGINRAHHHFENHGKGSGNGLGKRCPNYHHPDLQWTHALHGGSLEYSTAHSSSVSSDNTNSYDDVDERMLTALASVSFYGTDYYADGLHAEESKSCPIEGTTNSKPNKKMQHSTSAPIPGATRYDMGGALGIFDVSAFPGGDGFVVKHVDSQELVEVSIFHDDPELPSSSGGTVILVVLTVPPPQPDSALPEPQNKHRSTLYERTTISWRSSSWRSRLNGDSANNDSSEEDTPPEPENDGYRRHVVVADMETNSFKCEVVMTTKMKGLEENQNGFNILSSYPCSPAFFGRSHLPNLRKSGGEIVIGRLKPPPPGDELGCNRPEGADLVDPDNSCRRVHDESNVLQLVRRGDCNFMGKAANYRHTTTGVIVINSNPNELFVMAGEKPQPESNNGCSDDDLPVSVLVSGQDGDSIIQLLHDEESKGNEVSAQILLTPESGDLIKFPYVKGNKEALQILASNGWGIHAVPQEQVEKNGWQLFITQHNKNM